MYKNLLFDLDGTIVDSGQGIISGLKHTYKELNLEIPNDTILKKFIGPSVEEGFFRYGGIKDKQLVMKASEIYRPYFDNVTYKECKPYDDLVEVVKELNKENLNNKNGERKLFVASARHINSLKSLLNFLDLSKYFLGIYGSEDGMVEDVKKQVIDNIFFREKISSKEETLMIGDRFYDIEGAHNYGIKACGALWGYGNIEEFKEYNAEYIINNPHELFDII
ncbi:MAG: HAD hydrolase-like protein [Eubacteriales bacterium]|nr:HAD hydrolase-like protein [Eubacteriales bacterium]